MSYEELIAQFKNDVEHSRLDAARIPSRQETLIEIAERIWEQRYKNAINKSVINELIKVNQV